jgi:hypothetical protein
VLKSGIQRAGILAFSVGCAVAIMFPTATVVRAADATFTPIALSGDAAPQTAAGVTFDPTIGSTSFYVSGSPTSGRAAFNAPLTGTGVNTNNNTSIYVGPRDALAQLARKGNPAPDLTGWNYNFLNHPRLFGDYAVFPGDVINTTNFQVRQGYFGGTPGNVRMLAVQTMPAPTLSGVTILNPGLPAMNAAGNVYFATALQGSGINSTNNQAIYGGTPGNLSVYRRSGTQADALPAGVNYSTFGALALSGAGNLAFHAQLTGPGTAPTDEAIYHAPSPAGPLSVVARSGQAAPGLGAGVQFDLLTDPRINTSGKVLFRAGVTGAGVGADNNAGLWAGPANAPKLVMRDGGPAPAGGPGATYTSPVPNTYFLSDSGKVTFIAGLDTPTANPVSALWAGVEDGGVGLVAKIGDPAPGTSFRFASLGSLAISPTGRIAFNASLDSPTFQFGTWVTDDAGQLQKLVKTGDTLNIPGVGTRTVADMIFGGQVTNDNLVFNAAGELVTRLRFTNNTGGVFAVAIPEPTGAAQLLLAAAPALLRRSRRA